VSPGASAARSFESAAFPADWGDESPAEATPVEITTVSQMLPAVRKALVFMVRSLAIILVALLAALWHLS